MDPTTREKVGTRSVADFYDLLDDHYDGMTDFESRIGRTMPFIRELVSRHSIARALDVGSGSGFLAMILAELGVTTTAVDLSAAMVARLRMHARERSLPVTVIEGDLLVLNPSRTGKADAVFCVGNTLAHVSAPDDLHSALTNFRSCLDGAGHVFIQVLNYDKILTERPHVLHIKEIDGITYIRLYDYHAAEIVFTVLTLQKRDTGLHHASYSTTLFPHTRGVLTRALQKAGFGTIEIFGSEMLEPFDPLKSGTLFLHASA